ncbi:phenylalanine--tRNA ligase subunit beta [Acetonema longum]|uniref:Phenylalanine--tRNA ligase beta subunit n=1 Tax=Acetonema longum DSM 6540 TaxID=1009370 RepID=F7NNF4_9FIRM|nr:phenylalanine--tRNA ligase subunit beta [Acetonema longum]EGO62395.1 phenylalanyl-tRNA synthetase, beta subunit [Acetonema longum DSM 6540]
MRASIQWLKDYVDFEQTPQELADMLTMAGVPVEHIEYLGEGISQVVTGKILQVAPHPNADKLVVVKVDTGTQTLTICTGATNVRQGQVVPVALVGAKLPGGKEIGHTNLRGIDSAGMLCSAEELKLDKKTLSPDAKDGILTLPGDTPVGKDIREVLGLDDVVLEFELTANRADCFSVLGLAREVAVLTKGSLKKPILNLREAGRDKTVNLASVTIEEPGLCSRFVARLLQDVKIGPSPVWMQQRIRAAGMRPINNIVDVTNFVMLELGQPMHAYDYNLLAKHSIIVRKAQPGEKITTLDGTKRELAPDMLVIADAFQAVGVAGVMGGLATEVTANTQTVLLEAASFHPVSIRRASRALGLRSEASGRFERGTDTVNTIRAVDRAAKLLEEMGACKVCPTVIDQYPSLALPKQVEFTPQQVNEYLGTDIDRNTMLGILQRLEFEVDTKGDSILVTVPSWRGDVTGLADICEEVARITGYDNIAATTPAGNVKRGEQSYRQQIIDVIQDVLAGQGFHEVISFSFTHPAILDKLQIPEYSELRRFIPVLNPITEELPVLRTTLMGGILETISRNVSRKNEDLKIYEIGAVYLPPSLPLKNQPQEPVMLCGALMGRRYGSEWSQAKDLVDFYDAKGTLEIMLDRLGITDYQVDVTEHYGMHPGKTAVLRKNGVDLAFVGEVHPKVLQAFDLNRKVYMFECNISAIVNTSRLIGRYQALPRFPAIARDLAIVLPDTVEALDVARKIQESGGDLLQSVRLFDVYTGGQIQSGFRSLAFSLTFRAPDRTLTDEEIEQHYRSVIDQLEASFGAKLRV